MCNDSYKTLNKCLSCWADFTATYDDMNEWVKQCNHNIEVENAKGEQGTPEDLMVSKRVFKNGRFEILPRRLEYHLFL